MNTPNKSAAQARRQLAQHNAKKAARAEQKHGKVAPAEVLDLCRTYLADRQTRALSWGRGGVTLLERKSRKPIRVVLWEGSGMAVQRFVDGQGGHATLSEMLLAEAKAEAETR